MIAPRALRAVVCSALLAIAAVASGAELRPFDAGTVAAIRTAHAGRPYVLAFWSIHCVPCLEDLGDWRALMQKYPTVSIILVATDPPSDRARAAEVLARYRLDGVESWAFADEFTERVRFSVDRKWRGELPRTYYHDAAHRIDVRTGRVDIGWSVSWFERQRK